jgi:hypothetical protein
MFVLALCVAIPIITLPVLLVWYINIGGLRALAVDVLHRVRVIAH